MNNGRGVNPGAELAVHGYLSLYPVHHEARGDPIPLSLPLAIVKVSEGQKKEASDAKDCLGLEP